jgi:RNA polymerase sigma factor (TIGR02999 family)
MANSHDDLTARLRSARGGSTEALDQLFSEVYDTLRQLAHSQRWRWEGDYTLNTTALAHEAYLKLVRQPESDWQDRAHFMRIASRAMRHILVNYAERRNALKRRGNGTMVAPDESNPIAPAAAEEILELHHALERLEVVSDRAARVVECRFFTGLTVRETAQALGVSRATVERDWVAASAWLRRELQGERTGAGGAR